MFQKLVSRNTDLQALVDKGYAIAFDSNYLIVRDIPYLDHEKKLSIGAFVAKLVFKDQDQATQDDHQVFFAGSSPYGLNGQPIPNLGDRPETLALGVSCQDIKVQRRFSNKPKKTGRFADFLEKIESYTSIISGPAIELYGASPYTFKMYESSSEESVFKFQDTLTSRAQITDLSGKFKNEIVAIIGAGGTGGYILDFMVKTPVKEIKVFDMDVFHVHNAYRAPGKVDPEEFDKPKTEVYKNRYENFRRGLSVVQKYVDSSSGQDFEGITFAFICIDKGSSRKEISELLISKKIPFIDVGMGLKRTDSSINGTVRATLYTPEGGDELLKMNLAPMTDNPEDIYKSNIQISELNAINASIAVIRYKQFVGFYKNEENCDHYLFEIGDLKIVGENYK